MTEYKLAFNRGTPIWNLYSQLGVSDSELDQGYPKTDFINKKRIEFGKGDKIIQEEEILSYALDRYEKYRILIKEAMGYVIPWALDDLDPDTPFDAEIRGKITTAITAFREELTKAGYEEKKEKYDEFLALALYAFVLAQKKSGSSPIVLLDDVESELRAAKLDGIVDYITSNGGLGLIDIDRDCKIEATALETLENGCGFCSENSVVLHAVFRMAGLDSKILFIIAKYELNKISHAKLDDHAAVSLNLGNRKRIFDPRLKYSDAESIYKGRYDWWFEATYREYLSAYYLNLRKDYKKSGNLDLALEKASQAVQIDPNHYGAYTGLCIIYTDRKELSQAIEVCKKGVELYANDFEALELLGASYGETGNLDLASKYIERAITVFPDYAGAYYHAGNILLKKGDFRGAIALYKKAVQLRRGFFQAYNNMAAAYAEVGQLAEAHCALGRAQIWTHRFTDAIKSLKRTLEIKSDYGEAHYLLGVMYQRKGRLDEAVKELGLAIKFEPSRANSYYELGNALSKRGKIDLAIERLREAVKIEPENIMFHAALGYAYAKSAQVSLAIQEFERVVELDPNNGDGHLSLGYAYSKLGEGLEKENRKEEAVEMYKKSLSRFYSAYRAGKKVVWEISDLRKRIKNIKP